MRLKSLVLLFLVVSELVAAQIEELGGGFGFTEGPVLSSKGEVYFTDLPKRNIHRWTPSGEIELFLGDSGAANGLAFDAGGRLLACQGGKRRLIAIDTKTKEIEVLADSFEEKKLNSPNDLWIDPQGGIYFTDPRYGKLPGPLEQDGEHVYFLGPDGSIVRVAEDLVRPNGIIGTPDGSALYIADHGDKRTWRYTIEPDGSLSGKTLFADRGSDGMALDSKGNIYITDGVLAIYAPEGRLIRSVELPLAPANVCLLSEEPLTLFVTARNKVFRVTLD